MTKKLLFCLSILCFLSFSAKADDITGTYKGNLNVTLDGSELPELPNTEIVLSKTAGTDTYSLSIIDFRFMQIEIGDLTVDGITRTNEGANAVSLSKDELSAGPIVQLAEGGPKVQTYIEFTYSAITDGELSLELDIKGEDKATSIVLVEFEGTKQASGLLNPKNNSLAICVSPDFSTITTQQSGNYTIFNTTGATIQSGSIQDGTIGIADLKTGIYLIKINNRIAKFMKK